MNIDLSSLAGAAGPLRAEPPAQKAPAPEFTARVSSSIMAGEATLAVGGDALAITGAMDAAELPYADMTALEFTDYAVGVKTGGGDFTFSHLGAMCRPFYDALFAAYNEKVCEALFVAGKPLLQAHGQYRCNENGALAHGAAPLRVYEDCVCMLPPNLAARRVPLCFVSELAKAPYELTLRLGGGDSYTFQKLGYDTDPFALALEKQLRALREATLAAVKEIDPALTPAQATAIARLLPQGVAAPMGRLREAAPSFAGAVEARIGESRAAEAYKTFCGLCDPAQIYVGIKKDETPAGAAALLSGMPANAAPAPCMLWMIAPAPNGGACAVEFAGGDGDAAATYVYRYSGAFDAFAEKINRALAATGFGREGIRLPDEALQKPENARYRMAVQRCAALRLVRGCLAGRAIHRGGGGWAQSLTKLFSGYGE